MLTKAGQIQARKAVAAKMQEMEATALAEAERAATGEAERLVIASLVKLAKSLPVTCSLTRPTDEPVWVLELNPPAAGTKRILNYHTADTYELT
jgi:hypothetical protein